jgi:hypothetical protein
MAAAPQYKVYSAKGEYRAAVRYPEDAAVLVAALGTGATIRHGHSAKHVVWTEGSEDYSAGDSYDIVRQTIHRRLDRAD